ncbi:MAG: carbohydrate ABC transporter permease [Subdoligranulum variabile]|nr:carbohydrate ABC transporter permease [Subdoligranulum variabile]
MIVPFIWMLSASMKHELDVTKIPIEWIPKYFYPNNYLEVWNVGGNAKVDYHFGLAYFNSLKIAFFNVIGAVLTSSLAGYAFAKLKFKGRDVVFLLYLSTMMIPSQITIIPKFVIFDKLGMIGTHATLILPGIFTITGTFLMRQYFMQIPNELRESAKIDGASEFCTWWRIMLPMAKSSMAALAMMVFLWTWNNYLDALVFLPNWRLYTIPLALTSFIEESNTQYGPMMAAAASALIPVFIVFVIGQKQFVKGLTAGAVKG